MVPFVKVASMTTLQMEVFLLHYGDDFPEVDIPTYVPESKVIQQGVQSLCTIEYAQYIERDVFRNSCLGICAKTRNWSESARFG